MTNSPIHLSKSICVVMSVWANDPPRIVGLSLESIQNQTVKPDQFVVVVDGPVPSELESLVRQYVHNSVVPTVLVWLPKNTGLWNARNVGIQSSECELIALHDADDIMHPNRLQYQVQRMLESQIDILGTSAIEVDLESLKVVGVRFRSLDQSKARSPFMFVNPINHSTVMAKRTALLNVGLYRPLPGVEDLDLWRRLYNSDAKIDNADVLLQALSTSSKLLARRGVSIEVLKSELTIFHDSLVAGNVLNRFQALIILVMRILYRALPRWLMNFAQARFLRRQPRLPFDTLKDFCAMSPMSLTLDR